VARGEANDEVDRSGRRYVDEGAQRAAGAAQKVDVPTSRLKVEIARILKEEGYISNFKATEEEGHKVIRIYLKYGAHNEAAISKAERVSRPGCRVYVRRSEIPRVLGGMGINILTTPRGVMTGRQARKEGVGGELLCEIW
jgi:small subunit ribosomal protein S8